MNAKDARIMTERARVRIEEETKDREWKDALVLINAQVKVGSSSVQVTGNMNKLGPRLEAIGYKVWDSSVTVNRLWVQW